MRDTSKARSLPALCSEIHATTHAVMTFFSQKSDNVTFFFVASELCQLQHQLRCGEGRRDITKKCNAMAYNGLF